MTLSRRSTKTAHSVQPLLKCTRGYRSAESAEPRIADGALGEDAEPGEDGSRGDAEPDRRSHEQADSH